MNKKIFILFFLVSLGAHATDNSDKSEGSAEVRVEAAKKEAEAIKLEKENKIAQSDMDKFGFGLGFGAMLLTEPDIRNAVIEGDVVKVTEEEDKKMGFWLTASWIHDSWPTQQIGFGPFFGVQLGGNNEIVNSIAVGIDFSFKRLYQKLPLDFQVGYGITRIETLASGYKEDESAPEGVTQVLKKKTTEGGVVLIFSYKI